MTFVDDVRNTFDVAEFCSVVSSGVGEGRTASEVALRDATAVSRALAALSHFHALAVSPDPPDAVAAYIEYSPGASELFNALRAASSHAAVAAVALDCITSIVRYSLEPKNPLKALEGARSVVKDVVKTRAVLIYDVFVRDQKSCAKKALNLLRLVAQCHPVLAKEIVNRFNLGAVVMAPTLCTETNNHCRVPFLDLMFVLLASGDHDVVRMLSTSARDVLISCLKVIKQRTLKKSNQNHPHIAASTRQSSKAVRDGKVSGKTFKNGSKKDAVMPSHVQKRELIAAINLLLAIERHLFYSSNHHARRAAFAYPMMEILASIASADMPPLSVVPRQVFPEHEALRATASTIFIKAAKDRRAGNLYEVVSALNKLATLDSKPAVNFILRVIEEQPLVSKRLLDSGPFVGTPPSLSSTWFGFAAILSACLLRLRLPTSRFAEKQLFEKCLSHKDALVRETGVLLLRAFCDTVLNDEVARSEPQKYLPSLKDLQSSLKRDNRNAEGLLQVLSSYQRIFDGNAEESRTDFLKLTAEITNGDVSVSEDSIRSALGVDPESAVRAIFAKKHFSSLVVRAATVKDQSSSARLWALCRDVLKVCGLFPSDTALEIDIYLGILSSMGSAMKACTAELEKVLDKAHQEPYGLYDELQRASYSRSSSSCKTSLLTVAAIFRLKKLRATQVPVSKKGEAGFEEMLVAVLTTIVACRGLLDDSVDFWWLKDMLSSILHDSEVWWSKVNSAAGTVNDSIMSYQVVQRFVLRTGGYPRTAFLDWLGAMSVNCLQSCIPEDSTTTKACCKAADGVAWNASHNKWLRQNTEISTSVQAVIPQHGKDGPSVWFGLFTEGYSYNKNESALIMSVGQIQSEVSRSDMAILIAAQLRISKNPQRRRALARVALDILSQAVPGKHSHFQVREFIRSSLLETVKNSLNWMRDEEVNMFTAFAMKMLTDHAAKDVNEDNVVFSVSLLLRLATHSEIATQLRARGYLSSATVKNFIPLGMFSRASNALSCLILYYPALQHYVVNHIAQWGVGDFQQFAAAFLPVLQVLLRTGNRSNAELQASLSVEKACSGLLDAMKVGTIILPDCNDQKSEVLGEIGEVLVCSKSTFKPFIEYVQHSLKTNEKAWFLLQRVFRNENEGLLMTTISDSEMMDLVSMMLEWFGSVQLHLPRNAHFAAVGVFVNVLTHLRSRRVDAYGLSQDPSALEKALTALCSNILKAVHSALGCCHNGLNGDALQRVDDWGKALSEFPLHVPLFCVREILLLDLALDKAAKRSIISISKHGGGILFAEAQRVIHHMHQFATEYAASVEESFATVAMITAGLARIPRFGLDEELSSSLSVLEGVLSSDSFGYRASGGPRDTCIRDCMEKISNHMKLNGARKKFWLPDRRSNLFAPSPSHVIGALDKRRIACTYDYVFTAGNAVASIAVSRREESFMQTWKTPYDPAFVLKTFLLACAEARRSPGSAVLDLGKTAKDGVLGLAITALASHDENMRLLSYACVETYSVVVGPVHGVRRGFAATLYKDRRQLAFLLNLLKNSVYPPFKRILPVFAVWFRVCLHAALTPSHDANKAVTYFFMRSPSMDVEDCMGLAYLLQCDAYGLELQATRMLALQILRHGVWSVGDRNIIRKRKIIDAILLLGGGPCGGDQGLRREVLETLSVFLSRDEDFNMANELTSSHGLIPWLLPDTSCVEEQSQLRSRLRLLTAVSKACARRKDKSRFAMKYSRALSSVVKHFSRYNTDSKDAQIFFALLGTCTASICSLAPCRRRLVLFDIAKIYDEHLPTFERDIEKGQIAMAIAMQNTFRISLQVWIFLLESSIMCVGNESMERTNMQTLELPTALEVSMIHAFLAETAVCMKQRKEQTLTPHVQLLLAKAMRVCPTVWLTVTSISVLETKHSLPGEVQASTSRLPALPSQDLELIHDRKYIPVVDSCRSAIIDSLLSVYALHENS